MNKPFHLEPALLFATPPNLEELCAVTIHLSDTVISSQLAGVHQPQIIKCREIIFTEPDTIATPSLYITDTFHMVMTRSYFKTGKLHARFHRIGLEMQKPERVTSDMFQSCLHYTLLARLAPLWNKVGDCLLQGREFLMHTGYANAAKMELVASSNELYISVVATSARLPVIDVLDLGLSCEQLQQLKQPFYVQQVEIPVSYCWCHVLPSMKKTRIISVSNGIPQMGPFRSYKNFKRHWKNTYGYRLPETEEGMLFYQVTFGPMRGKTFTYPDVCVRAARLQPLGRVDPKPILAAFVQDLQSRLPSVCGQPLKFLPKLRFPTPQLYPGSQEPSSQNVALNLSNRPTAVSKAPFRQQSDLQKLFARQTPRLPVLPSVVHSRPVVAPDASQSGRDLCTPSQEHSASGGTCQKSFDAMSNSNGLPSPSSGLPQRSSQAHRNVSSSAGCPDKKSTLSNGLGGKDEGLECPTANTENKSAAQLGVRPNDAGSNSLTETSVSSGSGRKKVFPIFKPQVQRSVTTGACMSHSSNGGPSTPKLVPMFKVKKRRLDVCKARPGSSSTLVPSVSSLTKNPGGNSVQQAGSSHCEKSPFFTAPLPSARPSLKAQQVTTAALKSLRPGALRGKGSPQCSPASRQSLPGTPSRSPISTPQRKTSDEPKSEGRKPRSKPQVQELDVEHLARTNELQKANAATLQAWLKERGVACRAKDKKGDLVGRILAFLNLDNVEQ